MLHRKVKSSAKFVPQCITDGKVIISVSQVLSRQKILQAVDQISPRRAVTSRNPFA